MSGRHRSYEAPRSNPRSRTTSSTGSNFPTGLVAAGVVIVLAAGGAFVLYTKKHDTASAGTPSSDCSNPLTVNVDASPDIAPTLQGIAAGLTGCTKVTVVPVESASVAAFLNGSGKGGDVNVQPDVWIPDSSMWVDLARGTDPNSAGAKALAAANPPVATSPLVIGMPKPVADAAGWPAKPFGWADLLGDFKSNKFQVALPDPNTSGPGLAAITMLRGAVATATGADKDKTKQADALRTLTLIYRILSNNVSSSMTTLLTDLPTKEATAPGGGGIAAFPATEQKIASYNNAKPPVPLVALYPSEGTMMLDYPYAAKADLDDAHKKAVGDFLAAVESPGATTALQAAGFRDPRGAAAGILTSASGVNPAVPALTQQQDPTHTAAAGSLKIWSVTSEQTRGLVVLDISGSMGLPVPGQFDPNTHAPLSRLQVTAAAAIAGLPLFGDSSELGLWTFTTKSKADGGGTVHNELVPMGPLNATVGDAGLNRRAALNAALEGITVQPGSRNGLYDTILDSYKTVLDGWSENKVNAIVVFTDGKDDGLNSMTSDQLIAKLNDLKAANPNHPVRVVVVTLGKNVDLTVLTRITGAVGGQALHADTPADIGNAVIAGFAGRLSGQ